jgi:hypothetical protein
VQRRHVPRLAEPEEILRREGGRKEIVAEAADAQPSVDALVRADPIVHYTVNSTVNGYPMAVLPLTVQLVRSVVAVLSP